MQEIDIEAALRMAYARYRVHTLTPQKILGAGIPPSPGGSSGGGILHFLMLGTRVDTSFKAARPLGEFMRAGAKEADDMLDLHDAVLALPDVYFEGRGTSEITLWTAETIADAGATIERYPGDDEALCLHHADGRVSKLDRECTTTLVIRHALSADRPDWIEGGTQIYPVYRESRSGPRKPVEVKCEYGKACLIEYRPLPQTVQYHRGVYAVWHWAVSRLVASPPALSLYTLSGPRCPAEPWNESPPVVHKVVA